MLTVYQTRKSASKEESEDEIEKGSIIPAKQPYLTKINGKLVMARRKHDKSASAMNLLGEAFGFSTNRVVRRKSPSPECEERAPLYMMHPSPQQPYYTTSYASPNMVQCVSTPTSVYPSNMMQVTTVVPPQPPVALHRRVSIQTINSQTWPESRIATEEELAQLHLFDAHYRTYVAKDEKNVLIAPALQRQTPKTPKVVEEQAAAGKTIRILEHVCAGCGRVRSRKYHHDNSIKTGEVPLAFCRKCQRDPSSTSSDESSRYKKNSKKKKKKKKKKMGKRKEKKREGLKSVSPGAVKVAAEPSKTVEPVAEKKAHRTLEIEQIKLRPSAEYIVMEAYESDDQRQQRGRSTKPKYLGESEISSRTHTPHVPERIRSTWQHDVYQTPITSSKPTGRFVTEICTPRHRSSSLERQHQSHQSSLGGKDCNERGYKTYDNQPPIHDKGSRIHVLRRKSPEDYGSLSHADSQIERYGGQARQRYYQDQLIRYSPSLTSQYYDTNSVVGHQPYQPQQDRFQGYPESRHRPDHYENPLSQRYRDHLGRRGMYPQGQQLGSSISPERSYEHFEANTPSIDRSRQAQMAVEEQLSTQSASTRRRRERRSPASPFPVIRPWENPSDVHPGDGNEVVVTDRFTYRPKKPSVSEKPKTYSYADRKYRDPTLRTRKPETPVYGSQFREHEWLANNSDRETQHRERTIRRTVQDGRDYSSAERSRTGEEAAYQHFHRAPSPPSPAHSKEKSSKMPDMLPYAQSPKSDLEMEIGVERVQETRSRATIPNTNLSPSEMFLSLHYDSPSSKRPHRSRRNTERDSREAVKVRDRSLSNHRPAYVREGTDGGSRVTSRSPHHRDTETYFTNSLRDDNNSEGSRHVQFISPKTAVSISEISSQAMRDLSPLGLEEDVIEVIEEHDALKRLRKKEPRDNNSGWDDQALTEGGGWGNANEMGDW